jgi:Histidine kinase
VNGVLNLVGLSIGAALYAMLLAMVVRARSGLAPLETETARGDPLPLATAILGLIWNLCAFWIYAVAPLVLAGRGWIAVCGFSALGLLPAVVVHSVVRDDRAPLIVVAYFVSAIAAGLHVYAAARGGAVPSTTALRLLTFCFIGLLAPLAVVTRRQPGARRALWAVALAAFAVSALHLSQLHEGAVSWPVELVGHHASIPLAMAILYQDYPFAFADLFLKRALRLIVLVAAISLTVAALGIGVGSQVTFAAPQLALLIALGAAAALVYPLVERSTSWFVDAVVLTRPDYRTMEAALARRLQDDDDPAAVLDDACASLATALTASTVRWRDLHSAAQPPGVSTLVELQESRTATLRLPTSEPPHFAIEVAGLTGGRRLLSGDAAMLTAVGLLAARRIDAIRLMRERYARRMHEQEIAKLATEAELRALRAQLNPHFLFNALTTIGYLIQAAPERAVDTLMRLTTILRAVLRSEGEFTTLARELAIIDAYLEIEQARFEQRLRVRIDVPPECRDVRIPALLIQPLVENAVKHGIAPSFAGGEVSVTARLIAAADTRELRVTVTDTAVRAGHPAPRRRHWIRGIGLTSVERRLECHYGEAARLAVRTLGGGATAVEVSIPVAPAGAPAAHRSGA